jgi:uncharacterized protein (TIGR02996 family)
MDLLSQHEAFLRAIFDAPADDTPRLVYADFLEENGEADRAELIRAQCELARMPGASDPSRAAALNRRIGELASALPWSPLARQTGQRSFARGFGAKEPIALDAAALADPAAFRAAVVAGAPHWFGADALAVRPGRPLQPADVEALFALPFTQQVREWDLGGHVEEVPAPDPDDATLFGLTDMHTRPVVTPAGVEALARHRGARRITALILTHNNLDNDAARALVRSPYLDNLKRLDLLQGNRLRGQVWQQVVARFGEAVVG